MVSIIISSANAEQLKQVSDNIRATIGVPFEIIAIDNSDGKRGICAVYNEGGNQARHDILCFMHEDVIIKTENWGINLKNIFDNDSEAGLVGLCGGSYKPLTPSGWGGVGINNTYSNLLQSFKSIDKQPELFYRNPDNAKLIQVACVDGVFMATTRQVFSQFKFDEHTFKGFHAYDLDYSIAVGQHYKVFVTYELFLNHLSEGRYTAEWIDDTLKLHKKWENVLPVNIENFSREQCIYLEKTTFKSFIGNLLRFNLPARIAFDFLKNKKYKNFKLTWKLKYYILKMYLQKRSI